MTKKREILPFLNAAIISLSNMSADAAKLEVTDNDQASRRLKKAIVHFKNNELNAFQNLVFDVRHEIVHGKVRIKKKIKEENSQQL